jgi:hypothetical protein
VNGAYPEASAVLEHFHFENALTDDGASLARANEEWAKFIFAVNSECSVSKLIGSRGITWFGNGPADRGAIPSHEAQG